MNQLVLRILPSATKIRAKSSISVYIEPELIGKGPVGINGALKFRIRWDLYPARQSETRGPDVDSGNLGVGVSSIEI